MKAIIATAAGVLVLGGLVVANSGRTASGQSTPQAVEASTNRPTLVNCGEGRQAVVYANTRPNGLAQVECVTQGQVAGLAADPYARTLPAIDNGTMAMGYAPQGYAPQFVSTTQVPTRTVVEERVVYRDRPVTRSTRSARTYRTSSASSSERVVVKRGRSWKKSAAIIGGSTAGAAGVGALLGGKSGAKKGAVVGLVGGTVYDIATRNK
jgi:hypothetical protein